MENNEEIFYSLCIEDIQNVALEDFGRELTLEEIEKIKDKIADRINWYDAIYYTILDELGLEGVEEE